ncbi:sugar lactone lactonase YvrE [Pedobacter cryoconitis]|uniref:L-dopachrome tautomerase-related protein n=1 Tax=Pedobacter cryoconitis TaxID=188932 RepID=UPI001614E0A8|nr:L-dopachrome tautomerase-related protein [Pedobacter cryoconitis]MBB6270813.1 sugar lactone lactonase YvrE [Pedobacter cryoconitis]
MMKYLIRTSFLLLNLFTASRLMAQQQQPEIIASIAPPAPDMSGIAVTSDNRVFLGFPRHADNHQSFALAELVDGKPIPFPAASYVYPSSKAYKDWLVSPHGLYMDKNDVLWILDDGKRAGLKEIPEGAAKVVALDSRTKKIIHTLVIPKPVLSDDAHYNDLRVDLSHGKQGTVYIANSGFGERYSLLIIDVATGKTREVLLNHYSTSPEPGFMGFLEGKPLTYDFKAQTFPSGGIDGLALSPDSKTLYWTAITGRRMYSLPTAILSNPAVSEKQLSDSVKYEGEHPACDGLAEDEKGNIYFGAFEQQSLVQRTTDGKYHLLAYDKDNFVWPDGLAYRNGYLYVTLGQWNRLPSYNGGKDLRKPPYLVERIKVNTN